MKKLFCVLLSCLMFISVFSLVGCSDNLNLGLGIVSLVSGQKSADADTNGSAETTTTIATVLTDKQGRIVNCALDTVTAKLEFTSKGEYVKPAQIKTNYELGKDYGMVAYGNATKEWYEQVDTFTALTKGKTLEDVKALLATDGKGKDQVISAGCTIKIADFVDAIAKAVTTAKPCGASSKDNLKIGVTAVDSGSKNATEEANGSNELDITVCASASNNGKITAILTDALSPATSFDTKGKTEQATSYDVATNLEKGENYGMAQHGQDLNKDGVVKEWYQQAQAFNQAVTGKSEAEISALANDKGYANEQLQTAGCTINISNMVKSAIKTLK